MSIFYIFDRNGRNIGLCDSEPNINDLALRDEISIQSDIKYTNEIEYINSEIQEVVYIEPQLSEAELIQLKRSQYPKLNRYQFMRVLLESGFKSSDIEAQIMRIEDEFTRELTLLGFKEAPYFVRTDESILAMQSVLNLNDDQVDEMWEYALTL